MKRTITFKCTPAPLDLTEPTGRAFTIVARFKRGEPQGRFVLQGVPFVLVYEERTPVEPEPHFKVEEHPGFTRYVFKKPDAT